MHPPISKRLLKLATTSALGLAALIAGCEQNLVSRDFDPDISDDRPYWSEAALARHATTKPAPAAQLNVSIDNFSFNPPTLTVRAGATVTWVNRDDVPHTVTADDKAFASKTLDTDDQYSRTFDAPGTYPYFCAVHPHMTGRVIVVK